MPESRRWYHLGSCAFMCLLMAGLATIGSGVALSTTRPHASPLPWAVLTGSLLFVVLAVVAMVMQLRGLSTLVREFAYDGRTLRYRTLGSSREQVRQISEIVSLREPQGRAAAIGYTVEFERGGQIILDYTLTNVERLVRRLSLDVGV